MDTEGFENDYVTVLDISMRKLPSKIVLMVQSLLRWVYALLSVWTSKNDLKNTTPGRPFLTCFFFFLNGEKNLHFKTKTETCGQGLNPLKKLLQRL